MYPVCSMEFPGGTKLCCIAFEPLLTHINFVPLLSCTLERSHVASHILNLFMRWGREVSFVPYPLYHWKNSSRYPLIGWLGGPHFWSGLLEKRKFPALQELNHDSVVTQPSLYDLFCIVIVK
jgi:hypothetical protein